MLDEFKPELNINVIDPFGDAQLLAHINPENMMPLVGVCVFYATYICLTLLSRKKDQYDRRKAYRKAGDEDENDTDEQSKPEKHYGDGVFGRMRAFGAGIYNGLLDEHSLGMVFTTNYDDPFTRGMKITCLFCLMIGTVAVDAAFNANSQGGTTLGAMMTTSFVVSIIMYPCNVMFVFMFAKVREHTAAVQLCGPHVTISPPMLQSSNFFMFAKVGPHAMKAEDKAERDARMEALSGAKKKKKKKKKHKKGKGQKKSKYGKQGPSAPQGEKLRPGHMDHDSQKNKSRSRRGRKPRPLGSQVKNI